MAQADAPSSVSGVAPAFSFFMWLRRSATDTQPMFVLDIPGAFDVLVDPADQSIRSHRGGAGAPTELELVLPLQDGQGQVPLDEWILIGVSWDASTGQFQGWARSENLARVQDSVVDLGFVPSGPTGDRRLPAE